MQQYMTRIQPVPMFEFVHGRGPLRVETLVDSVMDDTYLIGIAVRVRQQIITLVLSDIATMRAAR